MQNNLNLEEIQKKLAEPFDEREIEWRVLRAFKAKNGKAYAFVAPYVESRAIMNRLDNVLGVGSWENEFKEIHNGILCGIRIHLQEQKSIIKYDGADLTDFEATKGGLSGAFKRAAVQWGIGRYLYNLSETMVEIFPDTKKGKNYINDSKKKITGSWNSPKLPNWALPGGSNIELINGTQQSPGKEPNNSQNGQVSRGDLNRYISKFEMEIGLSKEPEYVSRIFGKANNVEPQGLNYVRNAPFKELKAYYDVLKPVYQLAMIRKNYNIDEDEFLNMVQTYIVEIEVKSLFSCFFNVEPDHIKEIEKLARDTYEQRRKAS